MKLKVGSDLTQQSLLLGGPVNPDAVFVLHGKPLKWDSTVTVSNEIGLTTSGDILESIASGDGPLNYLIALGYSGWNPKQLDEELVENVWIQSPADYEIIFNTPAKNQVGALSKKVGFNLRMVSPDFGNA